MATWLTFSANDIPFISDATDLLNQMEPLLAGAQAGATLAATSLLTTSAIVKTAPDPAELARQAIDTLINDLVNTGLFALIVKPDLRNRSGQTGVDGYLRVVKNAFNDLGDLNRPKFGTGDVSSGIVFLISAPSFEELSALAEGFQVLFGESWQELIDFVQHAETYVPVTVVEGTGQVTSIPAGVDPKTSFTDAEQGGLFANKTFDPYKGQRIQMLSGKNTALSAVVESFDASTGTFLMNPPFRYELSVGDAYVLSYVTTPSPPDWQSLRVVDVVPICAEVTEVLASLRDAIPSTGQAAFQSNLIDSINRKAALFGDLRGRIQDVIDLFNRFGDVPSMSMLPIEPQDLGNQGFIRDIFNADNAPTVGKGDYTMGIVLYGGSGLLNILGKLFPV